MKDKIFNDSPEMRLRVHIGLIGVLLIIAIGFMAVFIKIDEASNRLQAGLVYLSARIDGVGKDVAFVRKAHEMESEPTPSPSTTVPLNAPFTLHQDESATLDDGSSVKLIQITDSRCKPGVQCIWAGELGAEVTYAKSGGAAQPIHLGLMTTPCTDGLTLTAITEHDATFEKHASCKK